MRPHDWPAGKPVPIAAHYEEVTDTFDITFDKVLQPGVINHLSFIFSIGDVRNAGTYAIASGAHVTGTAVYYDSSPVDTCFSWQGIPADIISMAGEPADPISNYPLT
jgi:hypothetical protein